MNRRFFLALMAAGLAMPSPARAIPGTPRLRRLRLVNQHTGESFDGAYRDDTGPIAQVMDELSVLLRDHHSGKKIQMDVAVIDFLADLMASVGEVSATVLSAYRDTETNAMLARTTFGVAENSQHLYGRALDIHLGCKLDTTIAAARAMKRGGVGAYPHSGFIHIDVGPVRNWTLDERGLANLLDGRRGGKKAKGGGADRPPVIRVEHSQPYQIARSEFLAHLR